MIEEWIQMGYSAQEAEELHELSKTISISNALSIDDATKNLMQAMNDIYYLSKIEQDKFLHNAIKDYIQD